MNKKQSFVIFIVSASLFVLVHIGFMISPRAEYTILDGINLSKTLSRLSMWEIYIVLIFAIVYGFIDTIFKKD